ncbi:MAG: TolC family protein [Acidobacteria bacterium]|nr:TolC family protein [Acidobacteriota bacterium]
MKLTSLLPPMFAVLALARPSAAQVSPPAAPVFLGGVPSGARTAEAPVITIVDAITRALEHNLGVLTAEHALGGARGTRWTALSDLLPDVSARIAETRQKINLAAFGFGSSSGGPSFPAVSDLVGPFNVFDARISVTQSVLDLQQLNEMRAETHAVAAARYTYQDARGLVIHVAGTLYLQALAAQARAASAQAQETTASALHQQAVDMKAAGLVAGIDVLRAEVQLATESQRATAAANDAAKARLQLARAIGLPLGQAFTLDPALPDLPAPEVDLEDAVARAYATRNDYRAALERITSAEAARRAVIGEALPSLRVDADYGAIGLRARDALGTYSISGAVSVPIFSGGRTHGRLLEADAALRRLNAEAEDLRASIYYEIQNALLDLRATAQELETATKGRDLAAQQIVQARDRFAAGVASNIEVVQAQEAVAASNEQYISALYGYDLAKAALLRGMGDSEETLRAIMGGSR